MSRLVELDGIGPRKLDESDLDLEKGDVAVCQCGLSEDFPFCDGSHRRTKDEDADACYRYVDDGSQRRKRVVRLVYDDGETEELRD